MHWCICIWLASVVFETNQRLHLRNSVRKVEASEKEIGREKERHRKREREKKKRKEERQRKSEQAKDVLVSVCLHKPSPKYVCWSTLKYQAIDLLKLLWRISPSPPAVLSSSLYHYIRYWAIHLQEMTSQWHHWTILVANLPDERYPYAVVRFLLF